MLFFYVFALCLPVRLAALGAATKIKVKCALNNGAWTCESDEGDCANETLQQIVARDPASDAGHQACNCTRRTRRSRAVARTGWINVTYTKDRRNGIADLFSGGCDPLPSRPDSEEQGDEAATDASKCRCLGKANTAILGGLTDAARGTQGYEGNYAYFHYHCITTYCNRERSRHYASDATVTMRCDCAEKTSAATKPRDDSNNPGTTVWLPTAGLASLFFMETVRALF
ncbi:hypothetical protein ERJ75_000862700 [Trypanosoma vivax]|nr:hypothetical protein ERJ75_000862700 [Trypanosoma vivax]